MAILSEVLEEAIERSYRAFVRPGDVIIDMGVSVGRYLLPMAGAVTGAEKIFGFGAINSRHAFILLEQAANWHYFAVSIEKTAQAEMLAGFLPQSADAVPGH